MSDTKRSGCSIWFLGLILALPVLGIVMVGGCWMAGSRAAHRVKQEQSAHARGPGFGSSSNDEQETVKLSPDQFGDYSPANLGSDLSREHFIAMVADQNATELARQTFAKNANGRTVRWLLKTSEVQKEDGSGPLVANFEMPYRIHTPGGWSGASVSIRAEFSAAERERLLMLRRSSWVTVEGRLRFDADGGTLLPNTGTIGLVEARIPFAVDAEKPAR